MQSVGPDTTGQLAPAVAEDYYGAEFDSHTEARRARRLEFQYGRQVHEWFSEGVPLDAMGDPAAVQRYHDRQGSPVPWDIEAFNRASRRRNAGRVQRSRQESAGSESGRASGGRAGPSERRSAGVPESVRDVVAAPGRSLDGAVQRTMEDRMDEEFGDVRVHTGPRAAQACEDIDARAFTVGNHVAFDRGEYDPDSRQGQHLIAHELAHVRQQTGGRVSMLPRGNLEIDPDDRLERAAEATARRVTEGVERSGRPTTGTAVHIQRTRDKSEAGSESGPSTDDDEKLSPNDVTFPDRQLQSKFKHAEDFGVTGNWNMENKQKFRTALQNHVTDPDTDQIAGTYRERSVIHFFNPDTGNDVIVSESGEFVSGWNLSGDQERHLTTTGDL